MLKKLTFLFFLVFCAFASQAQQSIVSGLVTNNANHNRIPYATLSFEKGKDVICDSTGHFLGKIKKGDYKVTIKAI